MNLLELRDELDVVDRQITALYEKRMALCEEVARDKIRTGKQVLDPERERQKLDAVASFVHSDFDKKGVRELYSQLMTLSRRRQLEILQESGRCIDLGFKQVPAMDFAGKRVVYQGVEGAYAHIAARKSFSADSVFFNVKTWHDAMEAVEKGEADYAVLPIENSSHGAVTDNFDLLLRYPDCAIVGETDLLIRHALLGISGAEPGEIRRVYSHAQAIGQCSAFFETHPEIEAVPVLNTALAAKQVAESGDRTAAALASEEAAELYGLEVLQRGVNVQKQNTTRFLIVGKEKLYSAQASKISICFETSHQPGALYNALGNFIFNSVNMLMIQSRPIPERNFEYRFFVDVEGSLSDPNVINALNGLTDQAAALRVLGCY